MKNKQREIKFRAWDKTNKKWVDSVGWHTQRYSYGPHITHIVSLGFPYEVIIMQYTGLKDKNGVEIYEGDILKNTKHKNQLVEVYWEGCFTEESSVNGSHWIDWGGWNFRKVNKDNEMTMAIYDNDIEVIGNIYENPNLLKTK